MAPNRSTIVGFFVLLAVVTFAVFLIQRSRVTYSQIDDLNFSTVKLAVLDGEKLKSSAKCFESHEKIAKMFADVLAKMRKSEGDIKMEYDKVKNNQKLSQKQKTREMSKIEVKWAELSAKYNSEIQAIRNTDMKVTERIQATVTKVIDRIANAAKLSTVINKGTRDSISVFYNSSDIDITDVVIKELDNELPSINLEEMKK
ncbi:MAG: OmpH family outer membrane protein [Holosporales bacterium]|nr:OmpH family outer membrane protein [Holosporales bacterium]